MPPAADVSRRLAKRASTPKPARRWRRSSGSTRTVATLNELADAAEAFYIDLHPAPELVAQHLTDAARAALPPRGKLEVVAWEKAAISAAIKETCAEHGMKMPQVAIPLRVLLLGQTQTPAIDGVVEVMGRDGVDDDAD
jgi:glutamyl-tRNA synthetase